MGSLFLCECFAMVMMMLFRVCPLRLPYLLNGLIIRTSLATKPLNVNLLSSSIHFTSIILKMLLSITCNRLRGTVFSGSKTPLHRILYICTFFLSLAPPSTVISQLHCSSYTASYWYSKLRKWIFRHKSAAFNGEEVRKKHAFKRARKKDKMEHSAVALWRERNEQNLWDAFLNILKCRDDGIVDALDGERFERDGTYNEALQNVVTQPEAPPMHVLEGNIESSNMNLEDEEIDVISGAIESVQVRWNALTAADSDPMRQVFPEQMGVPRRNQAGQQQQSEANLPKKRLVSESLAIVMKATRNANQHVCHQTNQQQSEGNQSCRGDEPNEMQNKQKNKRRKKNQSIPSFLDLCCLIPSDEKAIEYLASHGVFTLPKDTICTHCGYNGFRHKQKKTPKSLKCNRCNKGQSITRGTFFEHTKASIRTILHLAAHWLHKIPRADTMSQLKCSSATITDFQRRFRKLVKQNMGEDLRVVALTADKSTMSQEIPKGARRNELDEHYCVVLWREVNRENLWEAFLAALRSYHLWDSSARGGDVSIEDSDQVFVDRAKGTACCKYHLKQHLQQTNDYPIEQITGSL